MMIGLWPGADWQGRGTHPSAIVLDVTRGRASHGFDDVGAIEVFAEHRQRERLATLIRAYFDESADGNAGRGIFTVSGYVFSSSKLRALEKAWKRMLDRYQLPFFHMAECNADDPLKPDNVFFGLDKNERIACAKEAIKIARENTLHGHACVVRQEDYRDILESRGFDCDSYSFLLWTTLIQMGKWRDLNRPRDNLALFFEQGYATQNRANELLQQVSQDRQFREGLGLTSHAFFNKHDSYPGQAADLIAWHVRKLYSNLETKKPVRKDTAALLDGTIVNTVKYDPAQLHILSDQFERHAGSLARAARIIFNPDGPLYYGS
jgi:hypothetical protein